MSVPVRPPEGDAPSLGERSALPFPHPCLPSPWATAPPPEQTHQRPWTQDLTPPVIWSVAGTDSGGGAGLSADTRAATALGVHLCPVVAAVTAQHSLGVQAVFPLPAAQLQAQLQTLAADLPPRVVKTGLLASAEAIRVLLAALDELPGVALVVDPVLGASAGGAAFCDQALLTAYRDQLLPRTTLLTPNRREAEVLLGVRPRSLPVPELAARLRALGAQAVCITGGDDEDMAGTAAPDGTGTGTEPRSTADTPPLHPSALSLDWLDSPLASGWIALPRHQPAPGQPLHHHGSGCTFATAAAAAMARGFPLPDAVVLAKMLTWTALRDGHAAGRGSGPLRPSPAFVHDASAMPVMGWDDEHAPDATTLRRWGQVLRQESVPATSFPHGLYAITDDPTRVAALATATGSSQPFAHIQLRIKRGLATDDATLRAAIRAGLDACPGLWINDHWQLALEEGAQALHLGQEDWARLTAPQRAELLVCTTKAASSGLEPGPPGPAPLHLGLSSHSLWELARARGLAPSYIACGPVWPTTTKDMPWLPQGLSHLRWWSRMAGRPVVAIGGVLTPDQVRQACEAGAAAVCLVRAVAVPSSDGDWAPYAQAFNAPPPSPSPAAPPPAPPGAAAGSPPGADAGRRPR